MPIYNIQGPDGRIYSLEGPEGATEDQVINALKANLASQGIGSLSAPAAAPTPPEGGFIPAVRRGFAQTGMLLGDILPAMAARAVGADEYAERQFREAAETERMIQERFPAAVPSFKDVKDVGSALTYVTESVGELVPSILPSLFTGGVAGVVGRGAVIAAKEAAEAAARKEIAEKGAQALAEKEVMDQIRKAGIDAASKTALKYQAVGAITGSATQNVPEVYKNIKDETEQESLGASLLFGGLNSVLDAAMPLSLLIKARKAGIPGEEIVGEWYKRFGKGAAKGFATEGATEAAQEMSSAAAEKFVDENKEFFSEKNLERFINAGLKGGLGGGVVSGATDVMLGKKSLTEDQRPLDEDIRDTQADILARRALLDELRAQADEEGRNKLDSEALKDLGFGPKYSLYETLLNKDINDPVQAETVVNTLEAAINAPDTKGRERAVATDALEVINQYLSTRGEPNVGQVVEEPSGAGVSVPAEPVAPAPAEGVGAVERTGVVPPEQDVGAPVGGEGVLPAPVEAAPVEAPVEAPAPEAAAPTDVLPTTRELITQQEAELSKQMEKFQNLLTQQVQRFGLKDVAVQVDTDLKDANGLYTKGLIKLAVDAEDPVRALRHESVHALKELGFFTPAQWNSLVRQAETSWINTYMRNRNVDGGFIEPGQTSRYDAYIDLFTKQGLTEAEIREAMIEEAIADAFGDFSQTKAPPGMLQAILNRMKNFFRAIKETVGLAEVSPETIFGRIEKAELAAPTAPAVETAPEKRSVREVEAPPMPKARGMIAEVAPNPDVEVAKSWNEMTDEERTSATKAVANKVVGRALDELGMRGYTYQFSSGTYEGSRNPNIIVYAPESASVEDLDEMARVMGYVLDQKAMVAFDESNTTSDKQAGFVKVFIPEGFTTEQVNDLRQHIAKNVPQADGDTLRDGALLYGNFSMYNDSVETLSDEQYQKAIVAAVDSFEYDGAIDVSKPLRFHSDLIWPENRAAYLEGTRYGESEYRGGAEGADVRGQGRRRIQSISEDAIRLRDRWIDARGVARSGGGGKPAEIPEPTSEYGEKREGSVSAVGVHFSQQPRTTLISEFYGAGLKGAERDRLSDPKNADIRPRTYFYVDTGKGVRPEAGVGGVPHVVRLNNLYDTIADPLGIVKNNKGTDAAERATNLERSILKAGFNGFVHRDPLGQQGFAIIIGRHSIPVKAQPKDTKFSLRIMKGQEQPTFEGRVTVDKIGKYFDDQVKDQFGRSLDYNNPDDFNRALEIAGDEVDYQLKQEKSGLDWYEDDVRLAFEDTAKVIPQLNEETNRVLFSVIAGIMSPQTTARDNWFIAAKAYQHFVETGNVPGVNPESGKLWQGGTTSVNKRIQLEFLDRMIKDKGVEGTVRWLLEDHPVREINQFRREYGNIKSGIDGKLSDMKPGLYAFGPKVGPFVSNLNGIHDVTVDQWMIRTFNRYFGTMIGPDGSIIDAPTEPQRRAVKDLVNKVAEDANIKPYQVQSLLWFYEQRLYDQMGLPTKSYGFSDGGKRFLEEAGRGVGAPGVGVAAAPGKPKKVIKGKASLRAPRSEEFRQFMAGSKAVDADGNPIVYYHGSLRDKTTFRPKIAGAIFFSPDPSFAEGYIQYKIKELAERPGQYLSKEQVRDAVKQLRQYVYDNYGRQSKTAKDMLSTITEVEDIGKKTGEYNFRGELGDAWRGNESQMGIIEQKMLTGRNITPVYINVQNPFDYEDKKQVSRVVRKLTTSRAVADKMEGLGLFKRGQTFEDQEKIVTDYYRDKIASGDWRTIELPEVQEAIRSPEFNHDGFYAAEEHTDATAKNLAVFKSDQVVSATGNVGPFRQRPPTEEEAAAVGMEPAEAKKAQAEGDIRFSLRAPQTPEFKRWFGNSVVRERPTSSRQKPNEMPPKVVYHATQGDFVEFETGRETINATTFGDITTARSGIFFAEDPKFAEGYGKGKGQRVMPVYLSIQNPIYLDEGISGEDIAKIVKNADGKISSVDFRYLDADQMWQVFDGEFGRNFVKAAKKAGFDGAYMIESDPNTGESQYVWVAFEPNQIKSAIGNVGRFDPRSADIRLSLRASTDPAINARVMQTTTAREQATFVERITDAIGPQSRSRFRAAALNRYNRLGEYDKQKLKQMGGAELFADATAESAALLSDVAAGIVAGSLGVYDQVGGVPVYNRHYVVERKVMGPRGVQFVPMGGKIQSRVAAEALARRFPDATVKERGFTSVSNKNNTIKGPIAIFAPLAKLNNPDAYRAYQYWAGVKRGSKWITNPNGQVVEKLFDAADIPKAEALRQEYLAQGVDFNAIQKEWIAYNDQLVQYMLDTGVISKQNADKFRKHGDYLPFYRQINGDDDAVGPRIFQSISSVKAPRKIKGGEDPLGDFLENVVRNTQAAVQAGLKNVAARRAADVGMDVGGVQKIPQAKATPTNSFYVLENGEKVFYDSPDMLFIESIKSLGMSEFPGIGLLSGPAGILRNLVTKDPGFMLANMMRDSLSAWATSGVNMVPVAATLKNFTEALAGTSPEFKALMMGGVIGGYDYSQGTKDAAEQFGKELRKVSGTKTAGEKALTPFTSLWDGLEKGTQASDAATRIEVYKKTLKETGNEAEALFRALEVMNFNRRGNNPIVRVLTAAVPFLNARMQGLDVLYRAGFGTNTTSNAKAIQKAFWTRGMYMAALSTMYWMLTHDEEEYKAQEQETKDNNWLFPAAGIKIPIPFEVGVLFKVVPERIAALTLGDDSARDFTESMKRNLLNTLSFNPIPQTFVPIVEAVTNFNFFTMRPIVGQGMEGVAPEFQVGPGTSRIAETLGKGLNISPMKIDQIIQGYTGTIGTYMSQLIDSVYDMHTDNPKASLRFEQMPVVKRFILDPDARGQVTAYFDLKKAVDEATRTSNYLERSMDFEQWGKYYEENLGLFAVKDYILDMDKTLKEFREMKNMIRVTPMSADEKRDNILAITQIENQLAANIAFLKKQAGR